MNDCFDTTAGGQLLNLGRGTSQKTIEKLMESHLILTGHNSTNPVISVCLSSYVTGGNLERIREASDFSLLAILSCKRFPLVLQLASPVIYA